MSFPVSKRFVHYDSVPQWRLGEFYAQAHVFAIASREDGFGLVLLQALASGLPLVCTDRTGGADLSLTPGLAARIRVVSNGDPNLLAKEISSALADKLSPLAESDRQILSWRGYGLRYARELDSQEPMYRGAV